MLTTYRRHQKSCSHQSEGRKYRACRCVIWVDGFLGSKEIRQSLDTRDWTRAQDKIREWEAADRQTASQTRKALEDAWKDFVADIEARKLHESTIKKYKLLRREMEGFAKGKGICFLDQFDLSMTSKFREGWKIGPRTHAKTLERLRSFFKFAFKRKWIAENPAEDLKPPKVGPHPTLPYPQTEMQRILAAFDLYAKRAGIPNAQLLLAFVLLLRYSGMRIGDTVQCGPDRITGNKLFLYTQKTGQPVYCVLPDAVIDALDKAPHRSEKYFFWTGKSKLHSIIGKWQRRLKTLFDLAKIKGGHAHRFRDTFAVELLLSGVLLERVSILLGHSSTRITERHYSPWVRSRQEQLENDLTNAWKHDAVLRNSYLTVLKQQKSSNGKVHKRYTEESSAANDEESDDWDGRGGGGRTHGRRLKRRNGPTATNQSSKLQKNQQRLEPSAVAFRPQLLWVPAQIPHTRIFIFRQN